LPCPPTRKEQDFIANILFSTDNEVTALTNELEQWKIHKKALMQVLLTGVVRVRL
jgi:type I restriction enzyme S subunit